MVRGQPLQLVFGHVEEGVVHAQGREDPRLEKGLQAHSRNPLHQHAQDIGGDAVVVAAAGLKAQGQGGQAGDEIGAAGAVDQVGIAIGLVDRVGGVPAIGQPCGVGHQVFNGDGPLGVYRLAIAEDFDFGEFRQVAVHRIVQVERPLFVQHHRGDRGHGLGHGVDPEQGVDGHGSRVVHAQRALGGKVHQFTVPGHQGDGPRNFLGGDVPPDKVIDFPQALGGKTQCLDPVRVHLGGDRQAVQAEG